MKVYEAIPSSKPQLGMMWHGMALAHQAITDTRCVSHGQKGGDSGKIITSDDFKVDIEDDIVRYI